jgi:hypothetical protein
MTEAIAEQLARRKHPLIVLHKLLPRDRIAEVELQTLGRARICLGPLASFVYHETWDYEKAAAALVACAAWDGEGEPEGWSRHVVPGGAWYRPEGDASRQWFKKAEAECGGSECADAPAADRRPPP